MGNYPFAPTDFPGLHFWYKMDALDNTVVFDGTNNVFSTFKDQSGNNRNANWTGARALAWGNGTGGLRTARFISTASCIYNLPLNVMSGVTAAQIFVALKCDNATATDNLLNGLWDFSTDRSQGTRYGSTVDQRVYDGFGSATRFGPSGAHPGYNVWHRLSIKAEASGYGISVNNASIFSNAVACGSSWPSQCVFGSMSWTGGNNRLAAHVLEIVCFARVLSATEQGYMDAYLSDRIDGNWLANVPSSNFGRESGGRGSLSRWWRYQRMRHV